MTPARVYTPKEVAAMWRVSPPTVTAMIRRGELRAVRWGRQYRIAADAVEEYIQCQTLQSEGSRADTSSHGTTQTESDDATVYRLKHAQTPSAKR
jgi:excisionase family DNA binding protein